MANATRPFDVIDLGSMAYAEALAVQRDINRAVSEDARPDTLLLVEHPPVITVSHRKDSAKNLLASADELQQLGIEVCETDRGGDITYHGPGQLVAYPVVRLGRFGLNLGRYMRLLEAVVIETAARFGITAVRDPGATGVWVETTVNTPTLAKLCALGVRIRKNTTLHGLALNVTTNLAHFATIDPCGLGQRPVTSLQQLLGQRCPTMDATKAALAEQLAAALTAGHTA